MISNVADAFQRLVARSDLAVVLAAKVRNQCNRVIAYSICRTSASSENGEAWLLQQLAGRVKVFFDVGANEGDWTEQALKVLGPVQRGVIFEPGVGVSVRLKKRYANSPVIEVRQLAVGQSAGSLDFFESSQSSELSSLWGSSVHQSGASYPVPVTTVAMEFARIGVSRLDLLKVDTEGNDFFVLQGAEALLQKHLIGVVQFEYGAGWISSGSTLFRAVNYLAAFGYVVFVLKPAGLERFSTVRLGEYFGYSNFIAVSPEFLPFFAEISP